MKEDKTMIKLVITDVDDTIVEESSRNLNPQYYDVISEFRKKGILFVVASGRQKPSIKKTFIPVKDEIIYLADNGTDISAGDFETSMKFADEDYQQLARDIKALESGYEIMASKPDISFLEESSTDFYDKMIHNYGYCVEKVADTSKLCDICKVSLYNPAGISKEVERKMKERWSDKMDVCMAGEWYLDFTSKGANKGKALSIIQEHYQITPEETVAFGNADNDISMIRKAKYSFAVANASENLKAAASETIGAMKEDAVLKNMKEILKDL
jgi:Cof subfamily protein (haloacid dehalogenase superfamily)